MVWKSQQNEKLRRNPFPRVINLGIFCALDIRELFPIFPRNSHTHCETVPILPGWTF
jgi:hypothetical protein